MAAFIEQKKSDWTKEALKNTKKEVYWTDRPDAPKANPSLNETISADLTIVGAGFSGLWAALQAIEDQPGRKIVVLEAENVGFGASSRNGGFCEASLTHGLLNGLTHWHDEIDILNRMGEENIKGIIASTKKHNIKADFEYNGVLNMATAEWQLEELEDNKKLYAKYGDKVTFLNREEAQKQLNSPTYLGGLYIEDDTIMIDPAKLTWGLKDTCEKLGVKFYDYSKVNGIKEHGTTLHVFTNKGKVVSAKVILATNAWADPNKDMKKYIIPVYDHVLMTEPLSASQMESIGWKNRQGTSDSSNQFHYYRLTKDNRILWGGWDANYYKNSGIGPEYEDKTNSHSLLSDHFFESFPQLEGSLKFSNRWAGPIGTTSQFAATFGKKFNGKLAWVGGHTGLGVGASRFGARAVLDMVDGKDNEITRLRMINKKPMPFPPEPFRHFLIQYTKRRIAYSDANDGRRGLWLRTLDSLGLGFDS